ncbi:MAG TPA: HD domain-containing protein [Bacteroidales bacterium]|nr:HD domain-containing protein [Bacteroidales bacterium]HPS18182.1 HD domain-containing protein [Bacteroidales bacterium]
MNNIFADCEINFSEFILKPEYFDFYDKLHDENHIYRVMFHVLNIGSDLGFNRETKLAFFAAFIHDLSRQHKGKHIEHGEIAAKEKLPVFIPLFKKNGLIDDDIPFIHNAVCNHSLPVELPETHSHYKVTALLKDADALDKVRKSAGDPKLKSLRFEESKLLIKHAEKLFKLTSGVKINSFDEILILAENIKKID